jgi:uncharacterized repeat protein (TIGR01451 family)
VIVVEAPVVDQPPVANAGPDQIVGDTDNTGVELLTLDASGSSDNEGPIAVYTWSENGSQIAAGVSPQVPLAVGVHTITLSVTDGAGATATDTVVLTVDPFDPATNTSPIANAGPDQTVIDTDGNTLEVVTFDGTGSSDPDGTIVSYVWTLNGNPFGNAATFSVTRPLGTFVVTLTVTDNLGGTASDTVTVIVEAAPPPSTVSADLSISGPASVGRGDGVSFTVTVTNTGTSTMSAVTLRLTIPSGRLLKSLSPGSNVSVGDIAPGASLSATWTASADKEGNGTITADGLLAGESIATATHALTVVN